MPLTLPVIDDRDYTQILDEARRRIPVHNPEWTNFNDSDPGITVLQLFAFMTENLLYRSNLIPQRNRRKFLQLLGIPLRPASAAVGAVTMVNERGPLDTVTIQAGLQVLAGKVSFVTTNALDVLPVEARVYRRRPLTAAERPNAERVYAQLYGSYTDPTTGLEFYETAPVEPPASTAGITAVSLQDDTVDGALWLALLLRAGDAARGVTDDTRRAVIELIGEKTLTLGLMPALESTTRVLHPGGAPAGQSPPSLSFELSTGALPGGLPRYLTLDPRPDGNPFENLSLVQLTLPAARDIGTWRDLDPLEDGVGEFPPSLDEEVVRNRVLAWIRIRLPQSQPGGGAGTGQVSASAAAWKARFSWVGINAAKIMQQTQVVAEFLGTGSSEPDQSFTLMNTPVIEGTVTVMIGGEPWTVIDDLQAAPSEVTVQDAAVPPGTAPVSRGNPRVVTVTRESGVVRAGDGLRGARPPAGAPVFASYAYGGGRAGNVGIGAIRTSPQLPAGFAVSNPLPTWGGTEGETEQEAERAIPLHLQHRDRAVSKSDFRDILLETPGVSLGRADVLPLVHPDFIGVPAPGVVTVLLVPNDPARPEAPEPDRLFLQAVCDYLEPRRVLTMEIHLRGPSYVPVWVAIGIDVEAGRDIAAVREDVKQAIREFLSPLRGGAEQTGWPLEKVVEDRELLARAARVNGVAKIRDVLLWSGSATSTTTVELRGLELPRLERLSVRVGAPEDLSAELSVVAPPPPVMKRVPVPVLPATC